MSQSPQSATKTVKSFVTQSESILAELQTAIENDESALVVSLTHRWKGSCSTCGVNALLQPLDELIENAKDNKRGGADAILAEIRRLWAPAREVLEGYEALRPHHQPPAA